MPQQSDPYASSVWLRPPRSRGEQPTLSREQIVRAAIELLDAEGAAGLSMRRLGTRLGSGATSLYWYVANKDELLELAVDEVMAEVYVPEAGDTGWRIGASVLVTGMRAMLLRHPWVIGQLGMRPTLGPNVMRIGDRTVALLSAAGFSGVNLSHASSLLSSYAIGSATTVAAATNSSRQAGVPVRKMAQQLEPYLDSVAADHPSYAQWRRESGVEAMDPEAIWDEGFAFGLERLLDGLELWLGRESGTGP
ncbi:TetR/AcrR family transcriptional regulator C-terminal domain-containing protein [Dactylosporangium fulvum]|uniref:TetR/AcrR family transcriptional regulator C-terminal domain-containing protein n=1 Tax=Dactylosporangium fulvum TaxID=53359 RepID=A0ABY5W9V7_9ACTN|nr:TetR/AcrR family transcriptional regulator C-terminal domain-containing protein [Dactylosporangium fulvum]UWP86274.1 TetR/AcrR family transcriptional regulator C-terminal domain-containing protein [Dactylosporangium fulvum]